MAYVIVQHLDPTHKSILIDLVRRFSPMTVHLVEDGMIVVPDHIYVIPPNFDMAFLDGRLLLIEPDSPRGLRMPIDYFFRSMANDLGERAIGIILSGTGSDGTLGVREIKGAGGMVIVQQPESAAYDGMPRNAIATGQVDFIVRPADMPEVLTNYYNHVFGKKRLADPVPIVQTEEVMRKIFILLRDHTGHNFSQYKQNTIRRRIERRMVVNQIEQVDLYLRYLQSSPVEVETLFRELLIGVTNFFRDHDAFTAVKEKIIPALVSHTPAEETIRVWVPGCSTGEEAYSLAIVFSEYIATLDAPRMVQIFATDIDSESIERARAGVFPENIAADVSAERLAQFFRKEEHHYSINKQIRDMIVFAKQDVIKDPPFSRLDLISCRNLLIYFDSELQKTIFPLFYYALHPGGYLLLGSSESVGEFSEQFTVMNKKWKIYQRGSDKGKRPMLPEYKPITAERIETKGKNMPLSTGIKTKFKEQVDRFLLEKFGHPCVIVNADLDVLYIHGRTGKFLEPAAGEANFNLSKMAREGLKMEVVAAVHKSIVTQAPVRYTGLKVKTNGSFTLVNLTVEPMKSQDARHAVFMVIFEESDLPSPPPASKKGGASSDKDAMIDDLRLQVKTKEEYLQTVVEELETSNEELKSANEELQSANEELQSTNEELETSKEELQSVNEELNTVNAELQKKVEELSHLNNDMKNLLAGTGIGTIFVDHAMIIRRFTPAATQIINLIPTDVGRPVNDIVSRLVGYDTLIDDMRGVLETLVPKEQSVETKDGRRYLMRIQPYRTLENVIEGIVLTFVERTAMK